MSMLQPEAEAAGVNYHVSLSDFELGLNSESQTTRMVQPELYTALVSGSLSVDATSTFPAACIDGRLGGKETAASGAGASVLLAYGYTLAHDRGDLLADEGHMVGEVVEQLPEAERGVHTDDQSNCGCIAVCQAPRIFEEILAKPVTLANAAHHLSDKPSSRELELYCANAAYTINTKTRPYFTDNRYDVLQTAQNQGAELTVLQGDHTESLIVFNTIDGTTIDRQALYDNFSGASAFIIDYWAYHNAAEFLYQEYDRSSPQERSITVDSVRRAMLIYTLATLSVAATGSTPILKI